MVHHEIERKFLVISNHYKVDAISKTHIVQGFLNTHPERTIRIRIADKKGYLTIKGKGNDAGTTRFEWETEISHADATELLDLCEPILLEKIRHHVPIGNQVFEVDEFLGENSGLVIAEIELKHENEPFEKPDWLGDEVTGIIKYYNSQLSIKAYTQWKNDS